MAYNRRHFLEKVIEVQNIVKAEKQRGRSQKWIYQNLIKNKYHMCPSTFNNYMCINARRELALISPTQTLPEWEGLKTEETTVLVINNN